MPHMGTPRGNPPTLTEARQRPCLLPVSLLRDLFNSQAWDDGERRRVLHELFLEGPEWRPFLSRLAILIVLSTTIAAFGLRSNSAAVVIEAMLIAPLMTPILATAACLCTVSWAGWQCPCWF
jgi:hypothetical protein